MPTALKRRILARKSAWKKNALRADSTTSPSSPKPPGLKDALLVPLYWPLSGRDTWLCLTLFNLAVKHLLTSRKYLLITLVCRPQSMESRVNNWKWIYLKLVRIGPTVLYYIKNVFWCQIRVASVRKPLLEISFNALMVDILSGLLRTYSEYLSPCIFTFVYKFIYRIVWLCVWYIDMYFNFFLAFPPTQKKEKNQQKKISSSTVLPK